MGECIDNHKQAKWPEDRKEMFKRITVKKIAGISACILLAFVINICATEKPVAAQVIYNNKCCTSTGWCFMPYALPSGNPCFCDGWAGRMYGSVCW